VDPTLPFASSSDAGKLEPEYESAFTAWKQKATPQTRSELLRQVDPVIQTGIKSYGGPSRGSPNLRSQARRLALTSFDSYDPAKGSLKTHLLSNLRRLQRTGAQEAQVISLPERVALDKKHLDETENELRYKLGRDPSDMELADYTGLSLKRVGYVRQAKPVASASQIEAASEDASMPASEIPGIDQMAGAWENFVYYDLDPMDQAIFDMTLGRHGRNKMSTTEIARRLGLTPGAISQRAAKIQQKLDERFTQSVL
jgi:DNA-directed RNA polymerase specialized sigma subunit